MPQFLHTRLRVGDLERTIAWYAQLGFVCAGREPRSPQGNQLAFLEIPGSGHQLELCCTPGRPPAVPEDLVHTAVGYPDLIAVCEGLERRGLAIWPPNWRQSFPAGRRMAFITDPDGYEVELLETAAAAAGGKTGANVS